MKIDVKEWHHPYFKGILVTALFTFKYIHDRYLLLKLKVFA